MAPESVNVDESSGAAAVIAAQAPAGASEETGTTVRTGGRRRRRVLRIIVTRLISVVAMIFVVSSFTFFLVRWLPGNPVEAQYQLLLQSGVQPDLAQRQVQAMYGFISNQPLGIQYLQYLANLAHFNLGVSISFNGVSVTHLLLAAAPYTVVLVLLGIVASFVVGVALGVLAAVGRSTRAGDLISISGAVLHGIPQFVMAIALLYIFSTLWHVLPFGAPYDASLTPGLNAPFLGSLALHAVLPVATYALSSYGGWLLTTKASVVSVLGDDFIMAAELRGLKPGIILRYIARNAMLPLFTILTLSIGFMFGGALFIEQTFDYQGLGVLLLNSINQRDYPLMSGAFLLISSAVIIANAITELLYVAIDPRVRRAA